MARQIKGETLGALGKDDHERSQRFLQHLEPMQRALEAYARRNVYDPDRVEDVLQNAITKAFAGFHRFAEGTNFRAWMFHHLHLEILVGNRESRRQWQRHVALSDDALLDETHADKGDSVDWVALLEAPEKVLTQCDEVLAAAIQALNPLERSTLLLRAIGQLAHAEVADVLDTPVGTVMSALSRARKRLRERLADHALEMGFNRSNSGRQPR